MRRIVLARVLTSVECIVRVGRLRLVSLFVLFALVGASFAARH